MAQWYSWLVFLHVAAVFVFLMAHGVSAAVIFRARVERDLAALRALLRLSATASFVSQLALLVVVIAGVAAAWVGGLWFMVWPWAALGALVVIWGAMRGETAAAMRRLRGAAGFTGPRAVGADAKPDEVATAQAKIRPWFGAMVGGVGLAFILWLMVLKPF